MEASESLISIEPIHGVSTIRNKTLAQIFAKMELVETWGSGYERISRFCKKEGYPEPKWEEFGNAIRVTFYPHPATFIAEEASLDQVGTKLALSWHQVGAKLTLSQEEQKLLEFCRKERSLQEMMTLLGWKDRTKFRKKYVAPLLHRKLLSMTIPDKPKSSKQRYICQASL